MECLYWPLEKNTPAIDGSGDSETIASCFLIASVRDERTWDMTINNIMSNMHYITRRLILKMERSTIEGT
jgi:hypothetical protein